MTQQKHEDRDHALYAPSGAERWMTCHGSIPLSKGVESKSSSYAREGTECHEAAAAILMGAPWGEACKDLSDDQMDIVEEYTNYVFGIIDKLRDRFNDNVKVWIEERVFSDISKNYHGTSDCSIWAGRTIEIADLKAGYSPVVVRHEDGKLNKQLASYAVLVLDTHKLWDAVDWVRLTIVQPRVYEKPLTIKVHVDELYEFYKQAAGHIGEIEAGDDTLIAGAHCKYCPAKGRCPELRKLAVEKSKIVFDEPKAIRLYEPEELIAVLNEAEVIQQHIDGVRQHVRHELEKGRLKGMGWKLVPKRAVSKWTDPEAIIKQFSPEEYTAIFNMRLKSPKHIAKLLGVPVTDLAKYYIKESSGPTLAREDDPREAVDYDPFGNED